MLFAVMFAAVILFLLLAQDSRIPSFREVVQTTRMDGFYLLEFDAGQPGGRPAGAAGTAEAEDDSDMKIAGEASGGQSDDSSEALEFTVLKNSGELARAHALGTKICEKIITMDNAVDPQIAALEGNENARLQLRLMLTFCAFYTVENCIPSRVLQTVVINEFYDMLKERQPDYYNTLNESGSFSFYYLCVRGADKGECCIGQTYAMLIDNEQDSGISQAAQTLFSRFAGIVTSLIKDEGFAKETRA